MYSKFLLQTKDKLAGAPFNMNQRKQVRLIPVALTGKLNSFQTASWYNLTVWQTIRDSASCSKQTSICVVIDDTFGVVTEALLHRNSETQHTRQSFIVADKCRRHLKMTNCEKEPGGKFTRFSAQY